MPWSTAHWPNEQCVESISAHLFESTVHEEHPDQIFAGKHIRRKTETKFNNGSADNHQAFTDATTRKDKKWWYQLMDSSAIKTKVNFTGYQRAQHDILSPTDCMQQAEEKGSTSISQLKSKTAPVQLATSENCQAFCELERLVHWVYITRIEKLNNCIIAMHQRARQQTIDGALTDDFRNCR